jgi:hypothetical protein
MVDTAVALVQSYLYMNGYFTVTEYPILELLETGEYRTITDVDVLALRFPGAGRVDPRDTRSGIVIAPDPKLGPSTKQIDVIIAEVKEGRADLNRNAKDPDVLRSVLHRFGDMNVEMLDQLVEQLQEDGEASHPAGIRARILCFGSRPPKERNSSHQYLLLGHLSSFMRERLSSQWEAARSIQSKDPALSFLLMLEKAARGDT